MVSLGGHWALRGTVVWLTQEQGGRATGPPPRLDWDYAVTAFVPPKNFTNGSASFALRRFEPGAWTSAAEARWLVVNNEGDQFVEAGSVIVCTEGARVTAYFHVQRVIPDPDVARARSAIGGIATTGDLARGSDHWVLPVVGQSVTQLCFDFAVTLRLGNDVAVRIGQPFVMTADSGDERLIVPGGQPASLAPMLRLAQETMMEGLAFDDGRLELTLTDGTRVSVASSQDYEPWELFGPGGLLVVSVPGGELSIWRPSA